jgi:predicted nucleotidyltransferase
MIARFKGIKGSLEENIKKAKKTAAANFQVGSFFLFGSFARGRQTPLSDLDLAFLPRGNVGPANSEKLDKKLYLKLAEALGTDDITLVNLHEAPLSLAFNVLQGKLLFCRDRDGLMEYKERVLNFYPEINRLKNEVAVSFLKGMAQR